LSHDALPLKRINYDSWLCFIVNESRRDNGVIATNGIVRTNKLLLKAMGNGQRAKGKRAKGQKVTLCCD
jgi:hypothetical protein